MNRRRIFTAKQLPYGILICFSILLASCGGTTGNITTNAFEHTATSPVTTTSIGHGIAIPTGTVTIPIPPTLSANPTSSTAGTGSICPGGTEQTSSIGHPTHIVTEADTQSSTPAHIGDTIEIQLSVSSMTIHWNNTTSSSLLLLHQPAGYLLIPAAACTWDYIATGSGTAKVTFDSFYGCTPPRLCLDVIRTLTFTIQIS